MPRVKSYILNWDFRMGKGFIQLNTEDGSGEVIQQDAQAMSAVIAMLKTAVEPVFYDRAEKRLWTGCDHVGP